MLLKKLLLPAVLLSSLTGFSAECRGVSNFLELQERNPDSFGILSCVVPSGRACYLTKKKGRSFEQTLTPISEGELLEKLRKDAEFRERIAKWTQVPGAILAGFIPAVVLLPLNIAGPNVYGATASMFALGVGGNVYFMIGKYGEEASDTVNIASHRESRNSDAAYNKGAVHHTINKIYDIEQNTDPIYGQGCRDYFSNWPRL